MSKKRTLDSFFQSQAPKKPRLSDTISPSKEPSETSPTSPANVANGESPKPIDANVQYSNHPTYPHPVPHLPTSIAEVLLSSAPASPGKEIKNQPDLDLLYFQPYIPKSIEHALFTFLRRELFFYRVQYTIKRGPIETVINTPRYTTVFGLDSTSIFSSSDPSVLLHPTTKARLPPNKYACTPRPIPECLDLLRRTTEVFTDTTYNFCLVNYYATGADSISYHSDDERFLGPEPAIASFSLGARRDFLMKHKAPPSSKDAKGKGPGVGDEGSLKLPLASGDMVLMRGRTQACWRHSIPKRKGGESERGRINITFRKALERGGTENYYRYNVGQGRVWRWDQGRGEMRAWEGEGKGKMG